MSFWQRWIDRLTGRADRDLEREISDHFNLEAEEQQEAGLPPREARHAARRAFGNTTAIKENVRATWGWMWIEQLVQDSRYAFRSLRNSPGFVAIAVLTLALGIGFNSAMFSVLDAILLRPLPYPESHQLVRVFETDTDRNPSTVAPANLVDWQRLQRSFSGLVAWGCQGFTLTGHPPERVPGRCVSHNFFTVLGLTPAHGRSFVLEEASPGKNRVAVLSRELWQRRFGADPDLLGSEIFLNGEKHTVVGILPAGFEAPDQFGNRERIEVFVPIAFASEDLADRGSHNWNVVGRLRPGISVEQARSNMDSIAAQLTALYPPYKRGVAVVPLKQATVQNVRTSLLVLFGAVALILLLACANIANLLLARALGQHREIAIRVALGASRYRIVRELLTHSLVLALLGGCCGSLLAHWSVSILRQFAPADLPRLEQSIVDGRVLAFTLAISFGTGLLFGIFPALQISGIRPNDSLRGSGNAATRYAILRWRNALMVAQVALSLVLLVGAGLLIKSFVLLRGVELGFQPDRVLALRLALPRVKYPDQRKRVAFFEEAVSRVATLPGVSSAAFATHLPLRGGWGGSYVLEHPSDSSTRLHKCDFQMVSPGYFHTLGVALLDGRLFTDADRAAALPVAIINQSMARRFWPNGGALGSRLKKGDLQSTTPWLTIVGIVGDVRLHGQAADMAPEIYFPSGQYAGLGISPGELAVRTTADPMKVIPAIQEEIWSLDNELPITSVRTMAEIISASVAQRQFNTLILVLFASLAVVLALVGIYGVVSYTVKQRTAEMAIRIALGAQQGELTRLVIGRVVGMVGIGIAIGAAGAYVVTRFMATLLYGVAPHDPMTFASVAALFACIATAAAYLPARKVARLDPISALSYE